MSIQTRWAAAKAAFKKVSDLNMQASALMELVNDRAVQMDEDAYLVIAKSVDALVQTTNVKRRVLTSVDNVNRMLSDIYESTHGEHAVLAAMGAFIMPERVKGPRYA